MSTRRFIGIFSLIFILGALPFLVVQPTGAASAGLTVGFMTPIENVYHLLAFMVVGVAGAVLGRESMVLVPITCLLMFVVGSCMFVSEVEYPLIPMFMLGAILIFGLAASQVRHHYTLMSVAVSSSVGFHMGRYYMAHVPDIASPIYYLVGNVLALGLIFATSISFGVTLMADTAYDKTASKK